VAATTDDRRNRYTFLSAIFAVAWVIASFVRPDADYVVLPVLTAAAFPVSYRLAAAGPLPPSFAAGAAVAGWISTVFVALVMNLAGALADPSLFPGLGGIGQAMVLGGIGAAIGGLAATIRLGG
jgi:hypothetical protein